MELHLKTTTDGDPDTALEKNQRVVDRHFAILLYVRYVCFRVFLECAAAMNGGITENHKGRWLLVQLAPVTLLAESDIFFAFTQLLAGSATYQYLASATSIEEDTIRKLLPQESILFCVLDEAQALTKNLLPQDPLRIGSKGPPILRQIVQEWIVPNLIVSGTGISMQEVDAFIGSAVAKQGGYPETTVEIGGFDDEDGRRAYLERYFPPGFLGTSEGKELASRVGYWLHGRFVFNAAV